MTLHFVAQALGFLCFSLGLIYFVQAWSGWAGAWRRFTIVAALYLVAVGIALPPNAVAGSVATFALMLAFIAFVQALLKRKGAWRGLAATAAVYLVASSAAYFLTSPEQRAEILARRAAAAQQK